MNNKALGTFSDAGAGIAILVPYGQTVRYALQADGADEFIGQVLLQRSEHPTSTWQTVQSWTGTVAEPLVGEVARGDLFVEVPGGIYFRFNCVDYDDETDVTPEESDPLRYALAQVLASDESGVVKQSVITLLDQAIELTDEAGAGQFGSVLLKTMPAGNIHFLGAVLEADIRLVGADWLDTAEGDVALGTTAVTDADALATTEENIIGTTAIAALAAQAGPIDAQADATLISGAAGGTDVEVHLNVLIDDDAAHMGDVITNGAFAADTDWTKGDGWTIGAGVADCDGTQEAASDLSQAVELVEDVTYILTFTLTRSAGSVQAHVGGTAGTARSTADTFVEEIVAGGDDIVFTADADFVGTIDNVTLTPTTGSGRITGTALLTWVNLGDF